MDIDELARISKHPLAAGILGSFVGLQFVPGDSWTAKARSFVSGSAVAWYAGPYVCEAFGLQSPAANMIIGFGLGMFGMSLAGALSDGIKNMKLAEILSSWFRKG